MPDTVTINPLTIYTGEQLSGMLDVSEATLANARQAGELRTTKKGRRVLYLGEWVLDRLRAEAVQKRTVPDTILSPPVAFPPQRGLTISDVARRYRVKRGKVLAWVRRGELPAVNVAAALYGAPRWVITPDGLAEFERRRTTTPAKAPPRRKKKTTQVDFFPD